MKKSTLPASSNYYSDWLIALFLLAIVALGGFLLASIQYGTPTGFPLDDAWIHQTYARNLALRGEWAFLPGQVSAGSTAPLWSLLLSIGYWFEEIPFNWTFFLGMICLGSLALTGELLYRRMNPGDGGRIPWMGLFLAGEWHLVWAGLSGMETILAALLVLVSFLVICQPKPRWWLAGGLAGLMVWVRPDGITLLGPAVFVLVLTARTNRERLKNLAALAGSFLLLFLPYLLFNTLLAGSAWPNTFYAKQAEYAAHRDLPLWMRMGDLYSLPMIGAGVLLLPGLVYLLWLGVRERRWTVLAALLWWGGYTGLYVLRLPVIYQHGRYLMPAMPVYFLLGFLGTVLLAKRIQAHRLGRMTAKVLLGSIAGVWLVFYLYGAIAYAEDVTIIQGEMVTVAQWVGENTPPDAYIAAHDIGALGYFGNRKILDLAGLISPEVIPFIRDEQKLAQFMDEQQVDYFFTFPDWYPNIIKERGLEPLAHGAGRFVRNGSLTLYRWR